MTIGINVATKMWNECDEETNEWFWWYFLFYASLFRGTPGWTETLEVLHFMQNKPWKVFNCVVNNTKAFSLSKIESFWLISSPEFKILERYIEEVKAIQSRKATGFFGRGFFLACEAHMKFNIAGGVSIPYKRKKFCIVMEIITI